MNEKEIDDLPSLIEDEINSAGLGNMLFDYFNENVCGEGDKIISQKEMTDNLLNLCKLLNKLFFDYPPFEK